MYKPSHQRYPSVKMQLCNPPLPHLQSPHLMMSAIIQTQLRWYEQEEKAPGTRVKKTSSVSYQLQLQRKLLINKNLCKGQKIWKKLMYISWLDMPGAH